MKGRCPARQRDLLIIKIPLNPPLAKRETKNILGGPTPYMGVGPLFVFDRSSKSSYNLNINLYFQNFMKAKNITIDDLALMVSKGFAGMDKRFDSIEDRLGNLEKGFEEMKAELFFIRAELSKRVDKFSHKDL
ncbi:MAG: hypothetical protein EOM23_09825, partial [Candidatus Moranbacteria bacterium]|nr:hypothetical protein [Candidatus Moranbacteria bacterium]